MISNHSVSTVSLAFFKLFMDHYNSSVPVRTMRDGRMRCAMKIASYHRIVLADYTSGSGFMNRRRLCQLTAAI